MKSKGVIAEKSERESEKMVQEAEKRQHKSKFCSGKFVKQGLFVRGSNG